jgi:hypothetical protein
MITPPARGSGYCARMRVPNHLFGVIPDSLLLVISNSFLLVIPDSIRDPLRPTAVCKGQRNKMDPGSSPGMTKSLIPYMLLTVFQESHLVC